MRPYVSIDIETTGIDDKSHVLQISAVFDDLKSPISELKRIDLPIMWNEITYSEPYALGMNAELFKNMMNKSFKTYSPNEARNQLVRFLNGVRDDIGIDEKGNFTKLILAGKNVASFDIPKITKFMGRESSAFTETINYKTLDVGSLFYDTFGDNVSLSKINALTNRPTVSHNALEDALDVVYAVRYKLGVPYEQV
jgi:oligoribonuclease (3'-5' exoribonuclease)